MTGWGKALLTTNLLLVSGVVAVFGYDVWLARNERGQITQEQMSEMIAGVEERLKKYADESASLNTGTIDGQQLSNEELRETIKSSIETAMREDGHRTAVESAARAASSISIELGMRTQQLLERLTEQTASMLGSTTATRPAEASEAALMARVIDGINTAPPPAAGRPQAPGGQAAPLKPGESRRLTEVHFSPSSAALSPGALRKTRKAADELKLLEAKKVKVIGFTDTVGSPKKNLELSRKRAKEVADMLAKLGVPPERIEVVARGEVGGPESIVDATDEPLNRCVGIIAVR